MILPQTSARIAKLKAEGIAKRKASLWVMPDEFTLRDLTAVTGMTDAAASAQIQKMCKWREIEPTSEYKSPRTYRKVMK